MLWKEHHLTSSRFRNDINVKGLLRGFIWTQTQNQDSCLTGGPCVSAHAQGKTVSVKLSFLQWEMRRRHATWGEGFVSLNRGGLDSETARKTALYRRHDVGTAAAPKARRAKGYKSSGERICFNGKGQGDKNTRWNTTITVSLCNVFRRVTDGTFWKVMWVKMIRGHRSDANRDGGWFSLWWTHRPSPVSWVGSDSFTKAPGRMRSAPPPTPPPVRFSFSFTGFTASEGGAITQVPLSRWLTTVFRSMTNAAWAPFTSRNRESGQNCAACLPHTVRTTAGAPQSSISEETKRERRWPLRPFPWLLSQLWFMVCHLLSEDFLSLEWTFRHLRWLALAWANIKIDGECCKC